MDGRNTASDLEQVETKVSNLNPQIPFLKPFKVVFHHMQHKERRISVIVITYIKVNKQVTYKPKT